MRSCFETGSLDSDDFPLAQARPRFNLQNMSSPAATASSVPSPSFAGTLAELATPGKKFPPRRVSGDLFADDFADDVATLSYESALRTHNRYRVTDAAAVPDETSPMEPASTEILASPSLFAASAKELAARLSSQSARMETTPLQRNLKRASITIRLSEPECAQLRQRAAEAGISVSAYLRSCTLEVEDLRAQVKSTLAQLRSAGAARNEAKADESGRRGGWWSRLFRLRRRNA